MTLCKKSSGSVMYAFALIVERTMLPVNDEVLGGRAYRLDDDGNTGITGDCRCLTGETGTINGGCGHGDERMESRVGLDSDFDKLGGGLLMRVDHRGVVVAWAGFGEGGE
jgi:hypothetical protein